MGDRSAPRPHDAKRPRATQVERRALSESRIIASALRIIAEKGVQGMTLADAGERAGYSRGLPAHLFGSRAELLRACARSMSEQVWQDTMPVLETGSALEAIEAAVVAWVDLLRARPDFARAYYMMAAEAFRDTDSPEPFAQIIRDFSNRGQTRFAALIAAGVRAGEFGEGIDAEAQSSLLHASLRGLGMQWLLRPDLVDLGALTPTLTANLRSLLTRPHDR